MEVTINYNGQAVAVEVTLEVYEFLDRADHKTENLFHEQRRHWDGREFDEYIITTEGVGVYGETPEEYLCRMETLHELMAVLDTCTEAQRRRFLLYALDGLSLAEIGVLCGCSKVAVYQSVEAVRKKFINSLGTGLTNDLFSGYQVKGIISLIPARGGQRTSCPPLRFSGGKPMKTINLRWMYPHTGMTSLWMLRTRYGQRCIRPSGRWRTMSVGKSTTAPTTLWTHTAGWKITHWNTADRRKIFCWNEKK